MRSSTLSVHATGVLVLAALLAFLPSAVLAEQSGGAKQLVITSAHAEAPLLDTTVCVEVVCDTTLVVIGTGFTSYSKVYLAGQQLADVQLTDTDGTRLTAALPVGVAPGSYMVHVSNTFDGRRGVQFIVTIAATADAPGTLGVPGEKGDKGDTGDRGPQGEIGPQGPAGPAGARGETGAQGPTGLTGLPGVAGAPGVDGAVGVQGEAGTPGTAGLPGAPGDPGATGATGAPGLMGPAGAAGAPGAPGVMSIAVFAGKVLQISGGSDVYVFAGPTATVTTADGQKLTGAGQAPFALSPGTPSQAIHYGLCYQSTAGESTVLNFVGDNYSIGMINTIRWPWYAAASVSPGAGTWNVGICVRNVGANSIDNTDFVNGWVMVTQ